MEVHLHSGHIRWILSLSVALAGARSWASDIECASTQQPAERVICDHAILNNQYDNIYEQQQRLLGAGKVTPEDIAAWKQERDACADVHCVDGVFGKWKVAAKAIEDGQTSQQGAPVSQQSGNASPLPSPARQSLTQDSGTPQENAGNQAEPAVTANSSSGDSASTDASGTDAKPAHSTAETVIAFGGLGLLAFIGLGAIAFITSFFNRCSKCKRRGAGRLVEKEEIGRRTVTKLKKVTDKHYSSSNSFNPTSITERTIAVPEDVVAYRKRYQCRYCGHRWFTKSEGSA